MAEHRNTNTTRVFYKEKKGADKSDLNKPEFFVVVNDEAYKKWHNGEDIPLVDVVETFDVFITQTGGHSGAFGRAGDALLKETFGVSRHDDAVQKILTLSKDVENKSVAGVQSESLFRDPATADYISRH